MPFELLNKELFARYTTQLAIVDKNSKTMSTYKNYITGIYIYYNQVYNIRKPKLLQNTNPNQYTKVRGNRE